MRGRAVVQSVHENGVLQDARCAELVTGSGEPHGLAGFVDLHAPRTAEPHDPHVLRAPRQELADLGLEAGLILAGICIFHGQRRRPVRPAGLVRDVPHRDVRCAKMIRCIGVTDVHTRCRCGRIGLEDGAARQVRAPPAPPCRHAEQRVTIRELVRIPFPDLVCAKGTRREGTIAGGHAARLARARPQKPSAKTMRFFS